MYVYIYIYIYIHIYIYTYLYIYIMKCLSYMRGSPALALMGYSQMRDISTTHEIKS